MAPALECGRAYKFLLLHLLESLYSYIINWERNSRVLNGITVDGHEHNPIDSPDLIFDTSINYERSAFHAAL